MILILASRLPDAEFREGQFAESAHPTFSKPFTPLEFLRLVVFQSVEFYSIQPKLGH